MPVATLRGIIPAHLTPFTGEGKVDLPALRSHIEMLAREQGVTALMSNGHAGQAEALSRYEKRSVLANVLETMGDSSPILAGLVALDEDEGVQLAVDAQAEGAVAVVVFPLPGWKSGADRARILLRYLDRLAERTALPLIIFQQNVLSGTGYDSDTLLQACSHPAVVAVKEGSGTIPLYEANLRAIARLPRPVSVLTTHSTWLLSSLALGGDGILSAMSSVTPQLHAALLDALERSHLPGARAINDQLWPLTQLFYNTPGADAHSLMKTALHLLGHLPAPYVRPPLQPVSAPLRSRVERALTQARMLKR